MPTDGFCFYVKFYGNGDRYGSCLDCGEFPMPFPSLPRDIAALRDMVTALQLDNQSLKCALERIRNFPVHSEPVGGAYAMQDIAADALKSENLAATQPKGGAK